MFDCGALKIIFKFSNCHIFKLPLTLLEAWVLFVDHKQLALSLHDLAINTAFFNGSPDFHLLYFILFLLSAFSIQPLAFSVN